MQFSKAFGLARHQAELDFVDIDLVRDTPLFVDPYALSIRNDAWSLKCTELIVSFFQSAINAIQASDQSRARSILSNLDEPNETRLGMSKGLPSGRGVGGKQAFNLYEALRKSAAAQSGLLTDIAECDLFIEGIAADKVSDITTNVIRSALVEYTQNQCALHGITELHEVPAGMYWNPDLSDWTSQYARLPIYQGKRVILVPKVCVRFRLSLDSQEYYNHFMINYLQAEHLRSGSALVHTFKNGRRTVFKKALKELHPFSKDALHQFTKHHPGVLRAYKASELREQRATQKKFDGEFDEVSFAAALAEALIAIPPGTASATSFHNFMIGAIEFIFYPHLTHPHKEWEVDQGRKRIDIRYTNSATGGFFFSLHTAKEIASNYIMVECKNYSDDISNPELDQLAGRFSINRGKFGFLIARSCSEKRLVTQRCRDAAQSGRGFIVALFDDDIIEMLRLIQSEKRSAINDLLDSIFASLVG